MSLHVGLVVFEHVDFWLDMANALYEAGTQVTLYLSHKYAAKYMNAPDHIAERMYEAGLLAPACGVQVFHFPRMRDPRSFAAVNRLAHALVRDKVNVVHLLVGPGDLWLAALALRIRTIPVVSTMIIPQPHRGDPLPPSVGVAIQRLLSWGSDLIVVNGREQVALVQDLYGLPADRIAFVPLGPPTTVVHWAEEQTDEQPGSVLFFGEARPHKGLQYLVQAEPLIAEHIPQVHILIASRGEELKRCEQLMQDRSRYEIYEGFVPGSVMAALFQRAAVVALPYLSSSTSGVLMMAYVFGKPIVATTSAACLNSW